MPDVLLLVRHHHLGLYKRPSNLHLDFVNYLVGVVFCSVQIPVVGLPHFERVLPVEIQAYEICFLAVT